MAMPGVWIKLLLGVAAASLATAAATAGLNFSSDSQLQKKLAKDPVVQLNAESYMKFVLAPNRPYLPVVFYTAPPHICASCNEAEVHYRKVAKAYADAGATDWARTGPNPPVLFVIYNAIEDTTVPIMHGLAFVPVIAVINHDNFLPNEMGENFRLSSADVFNPPKSRGKGFPATDFFNWLSHKTGWPVAASPPFVDRLGITTLLVFLLCVVSVFVWHMSTILRNHAWVMGIGAVAIQIIGTCGFFWSLQHSLSFSGWDPQTGERVFIMRNRRGQFFGEGIIAACSMAAVGVLLLSVGFVARLKKVPKWFRNTLAVAALVVAAVLTLGLSAAFTLKTGISESWAPPSDYSRGPLSNDRGNTF